jgi:hypothetical protein
LHGAAVESVGLLGASVEAVVLLGASVEAALVLGACVEAAVETFRKLSIISKCSPTPTGRQL